MKNRALMIGGTGSHVGKSWMATAICRWLRRRGIRVAPFKAQNMSNNSCPCPSGGEIGRAQAAQAAACGLSPSVDMNPILLKPTSEMGCQVVVQGEVWRNLSASDYYKQKEYLAAKIAESYRRLTDEYEYIVVEGAGSVAELNLRNVDLVNLGFARAMGIPVLLVADIDRGGVFASICGSISLLDHEDAGLIRGFAVNRFRGDPSLFADGVRMLETRAARPCLGVFPFVNDLPLDEEDSVALECWKPQPKDAPSIAIVQFPRTSNHTDFKLLTWAWWVQRPVARHFDVVILPGSKNTIADLQWLRDTGLDKWIREQHAAGTKILGICGGYQMLGERIDDPHHVESTEDHIEGLSLLPVATTLQRNKRTNAVNAVSRGGIAFSAYEIHMGTTTIPVDSNPMVTVEGCAEGIQVNGCAGTYLHGALENPDIVAEWIGFRPDDAPDNDATYEKLADWFEQYVNAELFEKLYL